MVIDTVYFENCNYHHSMFCSRSPEQNENTNFKKSRTGTTVLSSLVNVTPSEVSFVVKSVEIYILLVVLAKNMIIYCTYRVFRGSPAHENKTPTTMPTMPTMPTQKRNTKKQLKCTMHTFSKSELRDKWRPLIHKLKYSLLLKASIC